MERTTNSHLKILTQTVLKDEHRLVMNDLSVQDRQNYSSLDKIMEPCVSEALLKNVPDSQGTVKYLRLCKKKYGLLFKSELITIGKSK